MFVEADILICLLCVGAWIVIGIILGGITLGFLALGAVVINIITRRAGDKRAAYLFIGLYTIIALIMIFLSVWYWTSQ